MPRSAETDIQAIETAFRVSLPQDYRTYLGEEPSSERGASYEFPLPLGCIHGEAGVVDHLHTAAEILENDRRDASCDAETRMLIIGYDFGGGYVYLSLSQERPGVYFRAPFVSGEYFLVGRSFSEFQSALRRVSDAP